LSVPAAQSGGRETGRPRRKAWIRTSSIAAAAQLNALCPVQVAGGAVAGWTAAVDIDGTDTTGPVALARRRTCVRQHDLNHAWHERAERHRQRRRPFSARTASAAEARGPTRCSLSRRPFPRPRVCLATYLPAGRPATACMCRGRAAHWTATGGGRRIQSRWWGRTAFAILE
jgi:hypothetical protein